MLIQRARSKALLAKHTNQGLVSKFSIGTDKAGGVHYTHLSLDNTLEPATSKTSLTIQGIYDTEENFKRRTKISKKINDQLSKLHMKYTINHEFPKLTSNRKNELLEIHNGKEPNFVKKQIRAKLQLSRKIIPVPEASSKFKPPKLFPVSVEESFKAITLEEFNKKIKHTIVLEPVDKIEPFEKESKTYSALNQLKQI